VKEMSFQSGAKGGTENARHEKTVPSKMQFMILQQDLTRSQAVARIADRTASEHLRVSRDVIGHVTI